MEDREVDLLTMPLQILPYIFQKNFSICFVNVRNESGPEILFILFHHLSYFICSDLHRFVSVSIAINLGNVLLRFICLFTYLFSFFIITCGIEFNQHQT